MLERPIDVTERKSRAAARLLLRLYPKPWRQRYGDELLELLESGRLGIQGAIDVVAGAIDARLSRHWSRPRSAAVTTEDDGWRKIMQLKTVCASHAVRYTKRDALLGAGLMLVLTAVLTAASVAARRSGMEISADFLMMMAFPGSTLAALPFTSLNGQRLRVQAVMIGGTLALLTLISLTASVINRGS
jgi:hypothetical protein